ncbi:hypothetical protein [Thermus sp.]|uniref:hypothetical protein n=1 Tax=Thermus sp. TaxID=275 RepID=UPI003D09A71E
MLRGSAALLGAFALLLQGVFLPSPRAKAEAGLASGSAAVVLKEDRTPSLPLLLLSAKAERDLAQALGARVLASAPPKAPTPGRPLYLLFRRLQLEGG